MATGNMTEFLLRLARQTKTTNKDTEWVHCECENPQCTSQFKITKYLTALKISRLVNGDNELFELACVLKKGDVAANRLLFLTRADAHAAVASSIEAERVMMTMTQLPPEIEALLALAKNIMKTPAMKVGPESEGDSSKVKN